MKDFPLVSVICICHNHVRWVEEALNSVFSQTYPRIELIVIDDASTDGSSEKIADLLKVRENAVFLKNEQQRGNCVSFNLAFAKAKGKYIIDFATDDIMEVEKIERQVQAFGDLPETAGVVHHDVHVVDEGGNHLYFHSDLVMRNTGKGIPEGIIFENLLRYYLVSSPSQMIRREVLEETGGFDETLSYEDFDFWMRTSRTWSYHFIPDCLMKYRRVSGGLSDKDKASLHARSTLKILHKVECYPLTLGERRALRFRGLFEAKEAFIRTDWAMVGSFSLLVIKSFFIRQKR